MIERFPVIDQDAGTTVTTIAGALVLVILLVLWAVASLLLTIVLGFGLREAAKVTIFAFTMILLFVYFSWTLGDVIINGRL